MIARFCKKWACCAACCETVSKLALVLFHIYTPYVVAATNNPFYSLGAKVESDNSSGCDTPGPNNSFSIRSINRRSEKYFIAWGRRIL
jgi:hypothetical protein